MSRLQMGILVVIAAALNATVLFAPLVCLGAWQRTWQDPSVLALLCLSTALLICDSLTMFLGAEDQDPSTIGERSHARLARASGVMLLILLWLCILERGGRTESGFGPVNWGGVCLAALGIGLRAVAILSLRRHFVTSLSPAGPRRLVVRGVYRWLRHPSETGLALFALGNVALSQSWLGLLALVPLVALIVWRTRLEDRQLALYFGVRFGRYVQRVPAFVPLT